MEGHASGRGFTRECSVVRRAGPKAAFPFLALLAVVFFCALSTTANALSFSDVPAGHPYVNAISELASHEVISGLPDGTFQPDASVTRQQFAKMIVKTLGLPVPAEAINPSIDLAGSVDPTDLFYPDKYVAVCYQYGLIDAETSTTFAPFDHLSRAQLITFVARAASIPDPPPEYTPPFDNFSPDHYGWARKAAYAGLLDGVQGIGPSFDFFQDASRGECAQVLHNLLLMQPKSAASPPNRPAFTPAPGQNSEPAQVASVQEVATPGSGSTGVVSVQGVAAPAIAFGVLQLVQSPYAIAGICLGVVAVSTGVFLVVRRARTKRRQKPPSAGLASRVSTQEEAQAILRRWREESAARLLQSATKSPTTAMDGAAPLASTAPTRSAQNSVDTKLWDELVESAQNRQRLEASKQAQASLRSGRRSTGKREGLGFSAR